VHRLDHVRAFPPITTEAAELPEDVLAPFDAHLINLGGTYGVPEAGGPIQPASVRLRDVPPALSLRIRRGTEPKIGEVQRVLIPPLRDQVEVVVGPVQDVEAPRIGRVRVEDAARRLREDTDARVLRQPRLGSCPCTFIRSRSLRATRGV